MAEAAARLPEERAPGIAPLLECTRADMVSVNETILSRTGSDVQLIPEVANHLIDSGGKRIRPMITLAVANAFGYSGTGHIVLAAAVEFMHTATLLHDDVVDESDLRRGKPAARMVWGNQASVLVGDFLLGQAFKMMVEAGSMDALDVLATSSAVISEGEVMQLVTAQNLATTEDDYLKVIDAKTAALFSAAAEVGAILGGQGADGRAAMHRFGRSLGVAFQLVDDALDYSGSQAALGKNVGDDLREGKVTLPVIVAWQAGDEEERAFWTRCLTGRDVGEDDLAQAIALLERHGAFAETLARARHYAAEAKAALDVMPAGTIRDALSEAVDFAVARAN